MQNREREKQILEILRKAEGFVSVKELQKKLYASESSIRRDLRSLAAGGLIKKTYGGAMPISGSDIALFSRRTRQNTEAKRDIAKKAAALIKEGDIVFLDASSTAFYLADEIAGKGGITVVTNNIEIMMLLASSNIKVISSGGYLSPENRICLIGAAAEETFEGIFADITFFSVKAIDDNGILSDCSAEEIAVRKTMLKNANKKIILCDSSKFSGRAAFKQGKLTEIDMLISVGE